MKTKSLRVVLVGAGRVGATYADDAKLAKVYTCISHAQILSRREDLDWVGVVDRSTTALEMVREKYRVSKTATNASSLDCEADIVVLATPPEDRLRDLEAFRGIRGVVVEKPLGRTLGEAQAFSDYCTEHGIAVQVNYWRRSDIYFKDLAAGALAKLVGQVQFINGIYCNGFRNNASHIIDFVRMLAGEVAEVRFLASRADGDISSIALTLDSGVTVTLHAVNEASYRENGLEIWGREGRLSILVEGLVNRVEPRRESRATEKDFELAVDAHQLQPSTVGTALSGLWDNFLSHIRVGTPLDSPTKSALVTERILAAAERSREHGGMALHIDRLEP